MMVSFPAVTVSFPAVTVRPGHDGWARPWWLAFQLQVAAAGQPADAVGGAEGDGLDGLGGVGAADGGEHRAVADL